MERVEKPWGYELIWAKTDVYAGKVLHICKGHCLSLQYHREKRESILVYSGKMELLLENEQGEMCSHILSAGDACEILSGRKHRMIALEECEIFEVSTPQLQDVVRIEDRYERV